jgi:hypothetical protein
MAPSSFEFENGCRGACRRDAEPGSAHRERRSRRRAAVEDERAERSESNRPRSVDRAGEGRAVARHLRRAERDRHGRGRVRKNYAPPGRVDRQDLLRRRSESRRIVPGRPEALGFGGDREREKRPCGLWCKRCRPSNQRPGSRQWSRGEHCIPNL